MQPIAMVLHELTTNSVKYGALSSDTGRVEIAWSITTDADAACFELRWTERGGPKISGPPLRRGFGSRLVQTTVRQQLHGDISLEWRSEGLECLITIPAKHVTLA